MANTSQISSLLLPVNGRNLLLPNTSVAEIIDYVPPVPVQGAPDWFLGHVQWRGVRLPVLSFDAANGSEAGPASARARIAILNTIGPQRQRLPFLAIVTQGIPRLIKVQEEEISRQDGEQPGQAEQVRVRISGEEATIPNLEFLESLALQMAS